MIVRKLRLKKGWSQEQLAELTDLSVRTIQRAERGQKQSLETARSLAAIFEVDISTFNIGTETMNPIEKVNNQENNSSSTEHREDLRGDEKQAIEYVKGIKEFYSHLIMYIIFGLVVFVFKSKSEVDFIWPFLGWGIGVIAHGLMAFEVVNFKMHKWEKKMIDKKLGRKL